MDMREAEDGDDSQARQLDEHEQDGYLGAAVDAEDRDERGQGRQDGAEQVRVQAGPDAAEVAGGTQRDRTEPEHDLDHPHDERDEPDRPAQHPPGHRVLATRVGEGYPELRVAVTDAHCDGSAEQEGVKSAGAGRDQRDRDDDEDPRGGSDSRYRQRYRLE